MRLSGFRIYTKADRTIRTFDFLLPHSELIVTGAAFAGVAGLGGDLLETVQETQNDEEEQALPGSQVSLAV